MFCWSKTPHKEFTFILSPSMSDGGPGAQIQAALKKNVPIATEQKKVTGQSIFQMHQCKYQMVAKRGELSVDNWLLGWCKESYVNTFYRFFLRAARLWFKHRSGGWVNKRGLTKIWFIYCCCFPVKDLIIVLIYISPLSYDLKHHSKFLLNIWVSFFGKMSIQNLDYCTLFNWVIFLFSVEIWNYIVDDKPWQKCLICKYFPLLWGLPGFYSFVLWRQCLLMKSEMAPEC